MTANSEATTAVERLAGFAAQLDIDSIPTFVRERVRLMLIDLIGVTVAGARTDELRLLREAWDPPVGAAAIIGAGRFASADSAAMLNGAAACSLELDEGNKNAQGHPAAHVVFAALAQAASAKTPRSGQDLTAAIVAGYEVAARFGGAMTRDAGLHTHGHWGTTGAGAAAARLRGLNAQGIAAAIDAASGLSYVTPWSVVLAGSFVRNLWAAGSNVAGLLGARLAAAGLAELDGTAFRSLGRVGTIDARRLVEGLGTRWDIARGYFKKHSSCSYTHPAVDVLVRLCAHNGVARDDVKEIAIETHRLTMPLAPLSTHTRIAAMFSLPFVAAVAVCLGQVGPDAFDAEHRADPVISDLARRVHVRESPDLTARLPGERAVRVTISLTDGSEIRGEAPNPVGDADYLPMGESDVRNKLAALLGGDDAERMFRLVDSMLDSPDVAEHARRLA